jgi:hypothetical protein
MPPAMVPSPRSSRGPGRGAARSPPRRFRPSRPPRRSAAEPVGLERAGDGAGGGVAVDVEGLVVGHARRHRGHHRDDPGLNRSRSTCTFISTGRPTKPSSGSSVRRPSGRRPCPTGPPPPALVVDRLHDALVHQARQHHLDHLDRGLSVTRLPRTKLDDAQPPSISLIIGPPPCTTTGFTPTCRISTMSRAKRPSPRRRPWRCRRT